MVRSAAELTQNVGTMGGSHGQSQILDTKGHVLTKGPIFGETLLVQELDLSQAQAIPSRPQLGSPIFRQM